MGEIWGDMGEIWGRYGGDMGRCLDPACVLRSRLCAVGEVAEERAVKGGVDRMLSVEGAEEQDREQREADRREDDDRGQLREHPDGGADE